jgi:hypothetical protein
MQRSDEVAQLMAALAKAQGEFTVVSKSGKNPTLQKRYTTLDDIIGAIRGPLSSNGLSIIQPLSCPGDNRYLLETFLFHESGEWISCSAVLPPPLPGNKATNALQMLGSVITYMRRYQLTALLGVNAEEDTDGNGKQPAKQPREEKKPEPAKANGNGKQLHWIKEEKVRKRFWAWARGDLVLTDDEVHQALGVEHVADYAGTMQEAKGQIEKWVQQRSEPVPA